MPMPTQPLPPRPSIARDHTTCPACGALTVAGQARCRACGFTGGDTLGHFGAAAPTLLLPVMDAADFWSERQTRAIHREVGKLSRRYPQFRWCFCAVNAPAETRLSLLGFWLQNVSPLATDESPEDRQWTVIVVINARSGTVASVPGYQAEQWLDDIALDEALARMPAALAAGRRSRAVARFLRGVRHALDQRWKHQPNERRMP